MREAGIAEKLTGLVIVVFMDQNPARQYAKRPFDDAHILVQHQVMDIGTVEQRSNCRNQHDVVGPNQFPHLSFLLYSRSPDDMLLRGGLAAAVVSFYGYIRGYGRLGKSGE
jgi:hypothetical protein